MKTQQHIKLLELEVKISRIFGATLKQNFFTQQVQIVQSLEDLQSEDHYTYFALLAALFKSVGRINNIYIEETKDFLKSIENKVDTSSLEEDQRKQTTSLYCKWSLILIQLEEFEAELKVLKESLGYTPQIQADITLQNYAEQRALQHDPH